MTERIILVPRDIFIDLLLEVAKANEDVCPSASYDAANELLRRHDQEFAQLKSEPQAAP